MKTIAITFLALASLAFLSGCGESAAEQALDKAAPPPGPTANLHPPTKTNRPPAPPTMGGSPVASSTAGSQGPGS